MSSLSPPSGGDQNQGPRILIVEWVLTAVALIVVGARIFGRIRITRNLGLDDLWIIIAMFFSTFYTAMCTAAVAAGNGRHPYYLGPDQTSKAIEINSIALVPAVMAFSTPKLAVAYLLMRLLNPSKWQRWFLYFLSISCIIFAALCAILLFAQCSPVKGLWEPTLKPVCWKPSVLINWTIFTGAYSAFVDLYLAVYPMTVLKGLQINAKKKIGLCFVLGLGLSACIIAIYKCTRLPELGNHADYTYATADLLLWTSIESNVIIISACLPTLRPFFLLATGRTGTKEARPTQRSSKNNYYLRSMAKNSNKSGQSPSANTDSGLVKSDSIERILAPGGIRRTVDVTVDYNPDEGGGGYTHNNGGGHKYGDTSHYHKYGV